MTPSRQEWEEGSDKKFQSVTGLSGLRTTSLLGSFRRAPDGHGHGGARLLRVWPSQQRASKVALAMKPSVTSVCAACAVECDHARLALRFFHMGHCVGSRGVCRMESVRAGWHYLATNAGNRHPGPYRHPGTDQCQGKQTPRYCPLGLDILQPVLSKSGCEASHAHVVLRRKRSTA